MYICKLNCVTEFEYFIKKRTDKKTTKSPKNTKKNENSLLNLYKFNQFYDSWRVTCSFRGVAQFLGNKKYFHAPQKELTTLIKESLSK